MSRDYDYREELFEDGTIVEAKCCMICQEASERNDRHTTRPDLLNCNYHQTLVDPTDYCKHFIDSNEV